MNNSSTVLEPPVLPEAPVPPDAPAIADTQVSGDGPVARKAPRPTRTRTTRMTTSQKVRRIFLIIHLWTGLILGLWFALMGITGSVVAWRSEISNLEWRSCFPLKTPPPGARMITLSEALEKADAAFPNMSARARTTPRLPRPDLPVYVFPMGRINGEFHLAAIDPWTGEAYPPAPLHSIVEFFEELHTQLLLGDNGNTASGVLAVFATFLLVTGIWLWWPSNIKQLKARTTVKWSASLQRRLYDLHYVMGIYLYPILLIVTLTTVHLVGVNVIERASRPANEGRGGEGGRPSGGPQAGRMEAGANQRSGSEGRGRASRDGAVAAGTQARAGAQPQQTGQAGGRGRRRGPVVEPTGPAMSIDAMVDKARQTVPNYELVEVSLPQRPEQAMRVMYRRNTGLTKYGEFYINPYNGEILDRTPMYNTEGVGTVVNISQGLHYGAFGGVFSKILYTITGLMPTGLFITGLLMWWRKKQVKRQRAAATA